MRAPALGTVNCGRLRLGLDVYGGGRVKTHVCPYCETALDANAGYQALEKFASARRPATPFELGARGEIFGVEFTIIGTLGMVERWGQSTWRWAEHQIFSPTHGYAWLTVEEKGHLTFTRKIRETPNPAFIGRMTVEYSEKPPTATIRGRKYRYYESGTREIVFAEGEFNWTPRKGRRSSVVSLASGDSMLSYVRTSEETEFELTRYLPPETYKAFGAKPIRRRGTHVLQPFRRWAGEYLRAAAAGAALVSILFALGSLKAAERTVLKDAVAFIQMPRDITLPVAHPDRLVEVTLQYNVQNSWAEVDLEVWDPEDQILFETTRGAQFYSGVDTDGRWTEGNSMTSLTFRPTVAGDYTLSFSNPVSEVDWEGGYPASQMRITATENVSATFWLGWSAIALALMTVSPLLRRGWHHWRRWSGSDWSDD